MDYEELVAKVIDLLQRDQRVPYRALKLRFGIDDDHVEALKDDLIYAKKLAADEDSRVLNSLILSLQEMAYAPMAAIEALRVDPVHLRMSRARLACAVLITRW